MNNLFHLESVLQRIKDDGFTIAMQKEIVLTEAQAREFYKEHENEDYFPALLEQMTRCKLKHKKMLFKSKAYNLFC